MNKQQQLFCLIKSMTKSEKRYFKLFNSTFEGKNKTNLKLFNAIDKQNDYDEKVLKVKFAGESFVKHFAVVKSNLNNSILKSLRIYNENSTIRKKIQNHKENYSILMGKGLLEMAKSQLDKGMKLAIEYDIIEDKIFIASKQNSLNSYFEFRNNKNKDTQKIFIKPIEYLEELNERYKYKYIGNQIDFLVMQNSVRLKKTQEEITRILALPEMQADSKPLSFKASYIKYHILLSCYVGQKNFDKALSVCKEMTALIQNKPSYKKNEPFNLLNNYNNYLHAAVRVASHKEVKNIMETYLTEMKNIDHLNLVDLDDRVFEAQYFYELEYYILNGEFKEAVALMPAVENELKKVEDKLSDFLYAHFNYNFAYLYFMYGDYLKSQEYVVKLTNSVRLKIRTDYIAALKLLKLFIHFELEHFELLSCELKNVRELLKRKAYLFEFEKQAINLLKKLLSHPKQSDQVEIYQRYKIVFEELSHQIENRDAFEKFNILHWINKKLQTTPKKLLLEIEK